MAKIQFTPAAERDLESIWLHTRGQWDTQQADRYADLLLAECTQLAEEPLTAAPCDHVRAGYRRRSVGRHVIYFRVIEYGVSIVRFLHDRMDEHRHL